MSVPSYVPAAVGQQIWRHVHNQVPRDSDCMGSGERYQWGGLACLLGLMALQRHGKPEREDVDDRRRIRKALWVACPLDEVVLASVCRPPPARAYYQECQL